MKYPPVLGERETLNLALSGRIRGFARYGDGDFTVMRGQGELYQRWEPGLAAALAECLADPAYGVLNCIPRPVSEAESQFYYRWQAFIEANAGLLPLLGTRAYGSAYISRMDSVPELHTPLYWTTVARLWVGRRVTLVRGSDRSLTAAKLMDSPSPPAGVDEVLTSFRNSWSDVEQIYARIVAIPNTVVLLCTGLAARPLVHRLVKDAKLCAYDLGHIGLYFECGKPRPIADCR